MPLFIILNAKIEILKLVNNNIIQFLDNINMFKNN